MVDSVALFQCFRPSVTATTLRQLRRIIPALLVITGRLTLLGLSRWTGTGGSYRTVQRFSSTVIPWAMRLWVFFRPHVYCPQEVSLLAGDEVVVPKAGTTTHGLERCFSRLAGKPVPGLACFTLSLVRVQARRSFPLRVDQVVRRAAEKATSKATAEAKQAKAPRAPHRLGRPPGHTNTPTAHVTLTPELRRLNAMIEALLPLIARVIPLTSLVLDGHFGHHNALSLAPQSNLPRIATRRGDAALSFPSTGPSAGRGPRRKYGDTVAYAPLPGQYRQETTVAGHMQTQIYHMPLLHRAFAQPFNVVLIVQTTLRTQDRAHLVLCSSDLALASALLLDSYALRCPLEFHFREAKQYWGLEDVMNVTLTGVTNAANVSLCRVNVAYCLRKTLHPGDADYSVLDLKADYRGDKYVEETIKMLPDKPAPVLCAKILHKVACLGRIHAVQPSFSFS